MVKTDLTTTLAPFPWRKHEGVLLKELEEYLQRTYNTHYKTQDDSIQAIDVWEALGSMESTCRDLVIKHTMRYGKKNGKDRTDLLKMLHYTMLMLYKLDKDTTFDHS